LSFISRSSGNRPSPAFEKMRRSFAVTSNRPPELGTRLRRWIRSPNS
jgi:hypothetical protein